MTNGHISQEDLTLHAMQALSPEEDAGIRSHLLECAACRAELASVTGDLALVALCVDQQPLPDGARERFLDQIAVPPRSVAQRHVESVIPIDRVPARPRAGWLPWIAIAALLLVCVSMGLQIQRLNDKLQAEATLTARLTASNAHAQEVLDVLTAPAAQRVLLTAAKTPPAPSGRAIYLAARGGLILQASNLARVADDKTYELWVIPANGSAPIPAGLFRPDGAGDASVVLPPLPVGVPAKAFGITLEKAGGSARPTAPILLSGAVPASGE
ncbi:MAG: anti-sigma factor [Terracidiphilus sp.]